MSIISASHISITKFNLKDEKEELTYEIPTSSSWDWISNIVYNTQYHKIIAITVSNLIIVWDISGSNHINSKYISANNNFATDILETIASFIITIDNNNNNNNINIFDLHSLDLDKVINTTSNITSITIVETRDKIVCGYMNGRIDVFTINNKTKELCLSFYAHGHPITSLIVNTQKNYIISCCSDDYNIIIWDLDHGNQIEIITANKAYPTDLIINPKLVESPDSNIIYSFSNGTGLEIFFIYDLVDKNLYNWFVLPENNKNLSLQFIMLPGKRLVSGNLNNGQIELWKFDGYIYIKDKILNYHTEMEQDLTKIIYVPEDTVALGCMKSASKVL